MAKSFLMALLLRRTYNPEDRRSKQPKSKEEAMSELVAAIENLKPDNFTPTIIDKNADYVYAEYQSPTFGFIDDVEFYFPPGKSTVEYRSASRIGESDGKRSATDLRLLTFCSPLLVIYNQFCVAAHLTRSC